MNWEAIGAIGEVVGAVAVVATIVYLAVQIRQNAKATEVATVTSQLHEMNHITTVISADLALTRVYRLGLIDSEELTPDERVQFWQIMNLYFTAWQSTFRLSERGLLDFEAEVAAGVRGMLSAPGARRYFETHHDGVWYGPFIAAVDVIVADEKEGAMSRAYRAFLRGSNH